MNVKINPSEYKVLIVDDAISNVLLLKVLLNNEKFQIVTASNGTEALAQVKKEKPDLVLLDVMMPDISGFDVAKQMKADPEMSDIPIIFLTALNSTADIVKGFQVGGNDFISKPFDVEEVMARIQAQLRRYTQFSVHKQETGKHRFKGITLDIDAREVKIQGNRVAFTSHEFDILRLLLMYPRKVFTRENLFETVWGEPYYGDDNTINVHISNIRSKIAQQDPDNEYIKTVWGVGFKMSDE